MFESPWHLIVLAAVIIILFGGRKIPELMRGMGEDVRGFKEGMSGNNQQSQAPPPAAPTQSSATTAKPADEKKS
jgi:sec-independent protein translocase protein TatA